MSTLTVTTISTPNETTDLTITTANTSGPALIVGANGTISFNNAGVLNFINTSFISFGNSTVNSTVNSTSITIGNSTVNSTVNSSSLSINGVNLSPFSYRNKIINGNMMITQRTPDGSTALSTNNGVYSVDRWWGKVSSNTTGCSIIQSTDSPDGFLNSLKILRTSGNTGTSTITVGQIIESNDCYDLRNNYITFSFYAKAGENLSNTNIGIVVKTGTSVDEGMANYSNNTWGGISNIISNSQTITTTWSKYSFTSLNKVGTSVSELGVSFDFTPTGTAGANDSFQITGVQLEVGTAPTPFETRPFNLEMQLCQRYYTTALQLISNVYAWTYFPVQMRTTPSYTGGGVGFIMGALNQHGMAAIQNSVSAQKMTYSSEL